MNGHSSAPDFRVLSCIYLTILPALHSTAKQGNSRSMKIKLLDDYIMQNSFQLTLQYINLHNESIGLICHFNNLPVVLHFSSVRAIIQGYFPSLKKQHLIRRRWQHFFARHLNWILRPHKRLLTCKLNDAAKCWLTWSLHNLDFYLSCPLSLCLSSSIRRRQTLRPYLFCQRIYWWTGTRSKLSSQLSFLHFLSRRRLLSSTSPCSFLLPSSN